MLCYLELQGARRHALVSLPSLPLADLSIPEHELYILDVLLLKHHQLFRPLAKQCRAIMQATYSSQSAQ